MTDNVERNRTAGGLLRDAWPLNEVKEGTFPGDPVYPGHGYTKTEDQGIIIERDVAVTLRDGTKMFVDIFRPITDEPVPVLISWSPYGKHSPQKMDALPGTGVDTSKLSKYTAWESPDPVWWGALGYALIVADPRGTWFSEGVASFLNFDEAEDEYDVIEWAAAQPWCNSKVGLAGVSYLAISQWFVGSLQPPHLTAMMPWEGFSDRYRECYFHGGIPEVGLMPWWYEGVNFGRFQVEDVPANCAAHPMLDEFWKSQEIDFSKITVPLYVVASWSDQGLHTRGTLEGFKGAGSKQKWLEVHGRKKWAYFYDESSLRRQLTFWDHFLKGKKTDLETWPKVRFEVRDRYYQGEWRNATAWPLPNTQYRPLYLNAATGKLQEQPGEEPSQTSYDPQDPRGRAVFEVTFSEKTVLVGHSKLRLWIEAQGSDDADLFVGVEKIDRSGKRVDFPFFSIKEDGLVALGWLRVSHRELDAQRSTPYQPWHTHEREQRLEGGQIVPVDIEIWPSGTSFEAGETLRLTVQGTDLRTYDFLPYVWHPSDRNKGRHALHTGGRHDAHLLVPVIPG